MVEQPVGGRPSRNRKRPTDHVGAYPRARAFPAVPPSPPLVMQRHRILSCDGEAARRALVPQTDFTLHSPSGGRRYESFHTTGTLTRLFIPTGETASPKDEKSARTLETPEGRQGVPKPPSNLRDGRGRPGFEAPGASFFRAREGVGGLRFRPSFGARHSPPTCPAICHDRANQKTNLTATSINSSSHNSAPNARPRVSRRRHRLPDSNLRGVGRRRSKSAPERAKCSGEWNAGSPHHGELRHSLASAESACATRQCRCSDTFVDF